MALLLQQLSLDHLGVAPGELLAALGGRTLPRRGHDCALVIVERVVVDLVLESLVGEQV